MPRFRSIASLLILRIMLLAVACMLVFGGAHAWWEYRKGQQEFRRSMETLVANSMISLSAALWDIEPALVREQVQWLGKLPLVGTCAAARHLHGRDVRGGRAQGWPRACRVHAHSGTASQPVQPAAG